MSARTLCPRAQSRHRRVWLLSTVRTLLLRPRTECDSVDCTLVLIEAGLRLILVLLRSFSRWVVGVVNQSQIFESGPFQLSLQVAAFGACGHFRSTSVRPSLTHASLNVGHSSSTARNQRFLRFRSDFRQQRLGGKGFRDERKIGNGYASIAKRL